MGSAAVLKGVGPLMSLPHIIARENPVQRCCGARVALVCVKFVQVVALQMHGRGCSAPQRVREWSMT